MTKNKKLSEKFNAAIWTGQYEIAQWPDQALFSTLTAYTQNELNDTIKSLEHLVQKKLFSKFPALPKDKMAVIFGDYAGKKGRLDIESIAADTHDNMKIAFRRAGPRASEGDVHQRYVLAIVDKKPGVIVNYS